MNIGHILDERYEIVGILGTGGMGCVFLAKNIRLGTLWAIKELRKSPEREKIILTEVDMLKNLEHHALPKVFDVIETADSFYVVFTYIIGVNLSVKLQEVGKFDEKTVIEWAISLCDVLSYLHNLKPSPIIYRDLKPSNIMLCDDGNIKLIDFGIAREYKEENILDTVFIGTRGYAAPEQFGQAQSGPYTDIYSLGITLHQLLSGRNPLASPQGILPPVTDLNPFISKELEKIISNCTYEEIEKRYDSAETLKQELIGLAIKQQELIKGNKSKRVETVIKTEKKAFYKQMAISLDNPECSSELAIAAAATGINVLLVDIDYFTSICDFYLGIQKQYQEYRIMNGLDDSNIDFNKKPDKYTFKLNSTENLNYIAINPADINEESLIGFLDYAKCSYDFIIINTSINHFNNLKKVFRISDKLIIADKNDCDRIDYWRRTFSKICKENDISINKVYYIGWLFDNSEGVEPKAISELLGDIDYIGEIYPTPKRRKNTNYCIGAGFANYKDCKKDYNKILFSLNISPLGYIDDTSTGLLRFLKLRRG